MCENCEAERRHLTELALANPVPCLVCDSPDIVGAATWIPDETRVLAAGGTQDSLPIFAFCLCAEHAEASEENGLRIAQKILQDVRTQKFFRA